MQERDGAKLVLAQATFDFVRSRIIRVDAGYAAPLVDWAVKACGSTLGVIRWATRGFEVSTRRWVIERTFAWVYKYRLSSKYYEDPTE